MLFVEVSLRLHSVLMCWYSGARHEVVVASRQLCAFEHLTCILAVFVLKLAEGNKCTLLFFRAHTTEGAPAM